MIKLFTRVILVFTLAVMQLAMSVQAQTLNIADDDLLATLDDIATGSDIVLVPPGSRVITADTELDPQIDALIAQSDPNPFGGGGSTVGGGLPAATDGMDAGGNDAVIDGQQGITLNFQDTDIAGLVTLVAKVTGRNFIVDPRVKGKVTLVSGSPVPIESLYDIFLSVLATYNFAALPSGNLTKIIPANLVKQNPTPTITDGELPVNEQEITYIVTLKHASVNEILPIIRPLLPPTAHIAPHAGSNSLILTDRASNIRRVLSLIERIDKEQQGQLIKVIYVKNTDAKTLGQTIGQLAGSLNSDEAAKGLPVKQTLVQVDEGLNALIIRAPEKDFPVLEALIDQLDVPRESTGNVHVTYLKHAEATDLVNILNGIIQDKQAEGADGTPLAAKISVQADEITNSLVIRAEQAVFDELAEVIKKLDVRRSQVFLEAIVAEVSERSGAIVGVDWTGVFNGPNGGEISKSSPTFEAEDNGFSLGFVNKYVRTLTGAAMPNLSVILTALREDSNSNVISTPSMLTLDNEEAEIVVGQEVPFVTGGYASTSGTTPGVGVNPFTTIERKEVGLTLKITPQINAGGAVRLEIAQEMSRISPTTVEGAADLITDKRTINTTVLVDDGQIIILGGLIRNDDKDVYERVPFFGDIPVIGAAFRKKSKQKEKINMMVFLRPNIIRKPSDLNQLTSERYQFIRTEEEEGLPDTRYMLNEPRELGRKQKSIQIPPLPDDFGAALDSSENR